MESDTPKQYLSLLGKTVLEHSMRKLLDVPEISGAVIAISGNDEYWQCLNFQHEKSVLLAPGGRERCDSVLSALQVLSQSADDDDWVLVHDAARPCVRREDINNLIRICIENNTGGMLAVPVRDTIKKACESTETHLQEITETVDRSMLWHAQTPQMFRLGLLREALSKAIDSGMTVTDESSAMEWAGYRPLLVEGHGDNIKITKHEDIGLALCYLETI